VAQSGDTGEGGELLDRQTNPDRRVAALVAALTGTEVLPEDYETVRIRVALHPLEEYFEVANAAIQKHTA
jgi:hypothetical protein